MWLCLNNAFLSIVDKNCAADELLVRARRPGDIERIFPKAKVRRTPGNDYLYRAKVKRADIAAALAQVVSEIDYNNFKDSVEDDKLHSAYSRVWSVMSGLQPVAPYTRRATRQRSFL